LQENFGRSVSFSNYNSFSVRSPGAQNFSTSPSRSTVYEPKQHRQKSLDARAQKIALKGRGAREEKTIDGAGTKINLFQLLLLRHLISRFGVKILLLRHSARAEIYWLTWRIL
jgi:hypothetical protein